MLPPPPQAVQVQAGRMQGPPSPPKQAPSVPVPRMWQRQRHPFQVTLRRVPTPSPLFGHHREHYWGSKTFIVHRPENWNQTLFTKPQRHRMPFFQLVLPDQRGARLHSGTRTLATRCSLPKESCKCQLAEDMKTCVFSVRCSGSE